jgi:basic membrane lipoprotein Med (substrate-binding protein (PBP1-ABC) superfamily)
MKKLIFFAACLVALTSQPAIAQTGGADVVVVVQTYPIAGGTRVLVSRSAGNTEQIDFKSGGKNQAQESEGYQQVFTKLYQEGYTLTSTFSPGSMMASTLVFTKKK